MVITKPGNDESDNGIDFIRSVSSIFIINNEMLDLLSEMLTSGEWMIDNNQASEQIALTQRVSM